MLHRQKSILLQSKQVALPLSDDFYRGFFFVVVFFFLLVAFKALVICLPPIHREMFADLFPNIKTMIECSKCYRCCLFFFFHFILTRFRANITCDSAAFAPQQQVKCGLLEYLAFYCWVLQNSLMLMRHLDRVSHFRFMRMERSAARTLQCSDSAQTASAIIISPLKHSSGFITVHSHPEALCHTDLCSGVSTTLITFDIICFRK